MRNLLGFSTLAFVLGAFHPSLAAQDADAAQGKVDFVKDVVPIFAKRCIECHGKKDPEADLRLDIKSGLFPASEDDWTVIPGKSGESALFERITLPADDGDIMPAEGKPLTKPQIAVIKRWIDEGAEWPADADAKIAGMLASSKPKVETIELPVLTVSQKAAEEKAIAAIEKSGGLAMRVAANTTATEVNLSLLGEKATNAQLEQAADLANSLIRLNLSRTKVDDAGLAMVAKHPHLRWLNLSNTGVTDAGLKHLSGLDQLRYLNLYGTAVTDAGLQSLGGLASLEKLFLWQSKATKQGAAKLQAQLPNVRIDMGEYAAILANIKPPEKPGEKKAPTPINAKCPITGKPNAADKSSVFEGQVIGFCCGKCKAAFDEDPAAGVLKVKEFKKAEGAIANAKCPVTDKGVSEDQVANFRGKVIGFCCAKCKAAFAKNPDKFLPKLAAVFPAAKKK